MGSAVGAVVVDSAAVGAVVVDTVAVGFEVGSVGAAVATEYPPPLLRQLSLKSPVSIDEAPPTTNHSSSAPEPLFVMIMRCSPMSGSFLQTLSPPSRNLVGHVLLLHSAACIESKPSIESPCSHTMPISTVSFGRTFTWNSCGLFSAPSGHPFHGLAVGLVPRVLDENGLTTLSRSMAALQGVRVGGDAVGAKAEQSQSGYLPRWT